MTLIQRLIHAAIPALLCVAGLLPGVSAAQNPLFGAPAPVQPQLSPDQVAQLYLDVVANGNADSARTLNDYLRISNGGTDVFNARALADPAARQAVQEAMMKFAAQNLVAKTVPKTRQLALLQEKLMEAYRLRYAMLKQAECRVLSSTILANPADEQFKIAKIAYQCQYPDIHYSFETARHKLATRTDASLLAVINDYLAALRKPEGLKTVTGTRNLYAPNADGPWSTTDIYGWLDGIPPPY